MDSIVLLKKNIYIYINMRSNYFSINVYMKQKEKVVRNCT